MAISIPSIGKKPTGKELITFGDKSIVVDIVGDFSPEYVAELTDHAIEDGSEINDHKVFKPPVLTLEVNQTEHPIEADGYEKQSIGMNVEPVRTQVFSPFLLAGGVIRSALGLLGGSGDSFVGYKTDSPSARGNDLFENFLELYTSSDPAIVTFKGRAYPDMSLVGLKLLHSGSHVGLSKFQLTFKSIRTVTLAAQISGVLPDPADLRAKPPKKVGTKTAKQIEDEAIPKKSLLAAGLDAL